MGNATRGGLGTIQSLLGKADTIAANTRFRFVTLVTRPDECQLRPELLNLALVRHLRG